MSTHHPQRGVLLGVELKGVLDKSLAAFVEQIVQDEFLYMGLSALAEKETRRYARLLVDEMERRRLPADAIEAAREAGLRFENGEQA